VIVVLLDDIRNVLKNNAIFIASGIIVENKGKVIDKMRQTGFEIAEVIVKDQWACIVGRNRI
jgi:ribosomal protein L11 methyltransferase